MNKSNHRFVIDTAFLKEMLKKDITLNEFILLMYFDNENDNEFDVEKASKYTTLDEKVLLETFDSLLNKKIITLVSENNDEGKMVDKVTMDNTKNDNFLDIFQSKYGKTLSSMDYEIVNAWLASGFSNELILGALEEANYNGVTSLKYIDKILFEWNKKGFKTIDDVIKYKKKEYLDNKKLETNVLEFDWLDEAE